MAELQCNFELEPAAKKQDFLREVQAFYAGTPKAMIEFIDRKVYPYQRVEQTLEQLLPAIGEKSFIKVHTGFWNPSSAFRYQEELPPDLNQSQVEQRPHFIRVAALTDDESMMIDYDMLETPTTFERMDSLVKMIFGYSLPEAHGLGIQEFGMTIRTEISEDQIARIRFQDNAILFLVPYAPYGNIEDLGSAGLYKGLLAASAVHRRGHYLYESDKGFWSRGDVTPIQFSRYLRAARNLMPILSNTKDQELKLRTILGECAGLQRRLDQNQEQTGEQYKSFSDIINDPTIMFIAKL